MFVRRVEIDAAFQAAASMRLSFFSSGDRLQRLWHGIDDSEKIQESGV